MLAVDFSASPWYKIVIFPLFTATFVVKKSRRAQSKLPILPILCGGKKPNEVQHLLCFRNCAGSFYTYFLYNWECNPEIKVLLIPIIRKLTSERLSNLWLKDLNIRQDTTKLLEENTGKAFGGINFSNIFLISQSNIYIYKQMDSNQACKLFCSKKKPQTKWKDNLWTGGKYLQMMQPRA